MTGEPVIALLSLTAMEIVLGIDNIIFIAILAGRLPPDQRARARRLGLALALATRLGLLFTLSWMLSLTRPIFTLTDLGLPESWLSAETAQVSWRDVILLVGGLFLIAKSTHEIHDKLEGGGEEVPGGRPAASFGWTLAQIAILDIIFSLDSVITAVGMARELWVMVAAMVIAVGVMLAFAGPVSDFVHRHPTLRMLALSFLILIGVMLVAEAFGQHIDRGYIYFAMGFSLVVELLNLRVRTPAAEPVQLHEPRPPEALRTGAGTA
jgi:predicted tellurium resistance membrane protein TerC